MIQKVNKCVKKQTINEVRKGSLYCFQINMNFASCNSWL